MHSEAPEYKNGTGIGREIFTLAFLTMGFCYNYNPYTMSSYSIRLFFCKADVKWPFMDELFFWEWPQTDAVIHVETFKNKGHCTRKDKLSQKQNSD